MTSCSSHNCARRRFWFSFCGTMAGAHARASSALVLQRSDLGLSSLPPVVAESTCVPARSAYGIPMQKPEGAHSMKYPGDRVRGVEYQPPLSPLSNHVNLTGGYLSKVPSTNWPSGQSRLGETLPVEIAGKANTCTNSCMPRMHANFSKNTSERVKRVTTDTTLATSTSDPADMLRTMIARAHAAAISVFDKKVDTGPAITMAAPEVSPLCCHEPCQSSTLSARRHFSVRDFA